MVFRVGSQRRAARIVDSLNSSCISRQRDNTELSKHLSDLVNSLNGGEFERLDNALRRVMKDPFLKVQLLQGIKVGARGRITGLRLPMGAENTSREFVQALGGKIPEIIIPCSTLGAMDAIEKCGVRKLTVVINPTRPEAVDLSCLANVKSLKEVTVRRATKNGVPLNVIDGLETLKGIEVKTEPIIRWATGAGRGRRIKSYDGA